MAGRGADEGGRKPAGSGEPKAARVRARKLRPRGQKSRDGAPRGAASFAKDAHAARRKNGCAARRSIPSGLPEGKEGPAKGGETTAHPAPQRIGAMALGLIRRLGCLTIESGVRKPLVPAKAGRQPLDARLRGHDAEQADDPALNAVSAFPRPPRATASARSNPPAPPRPRARRLRPASRWSRSNPAGRCR